MSRQEGEVGARPQQGCVRGFRSDGEPQGRGYNLATAAPSQQVALGVKPAVSHHVLLVSLVWGSPAGKGRLLSTALSLGGTHIVICLHFYRFG